MIPARWASLFFLPEHRDMPGGKEKRRTLAGAAPLRKGFGNRALLALLLLDVLHDIADLLELLGILVGDFNAEFLLERHDKLDGVE